MDSESKSMINNFGFNDEVSNFSILVVSCDHYSDVWPHFFYLFNKYWPDCPNQVFLGSNYVKYNDPRISNLLIGKDSSWAEGAKKMVESIPTEYFMFLLEDFFFRKTVETKRVVDCLKALTRLSGGYLRLRPFPKPDRFLSNYPNIGQIDKGAPYRLSLQAAIWSKDLFLQLVRPGESAWDMEIKGSRRSDYVSNGFYSTWEPILYYQAGITLGKWSPQGMKVCKKEQMQIDYSKRLPMTPEEIRNLNFRRLINNNISVIPWKIRRKMKQILNYIL